MTISVVKGELLWSPSLGYGILNKSKNLCCAGLCFRPTVPRTLVDHAEWRTRGVQKQKSAQLYHEQRQTDRQRKQKCLGTEDDEGAERGKQGTGFRNSMITGPDEIPVSLSPWYYIVSHF